VPFLLIREASAFGFNNNDPNESGTGHGSVNENWVVEDRRKLLAFAWGLLISDYAGHRLPFEVIAQSPPFAHLNVVHNIF